MPHTSRKAQKIVFTAYVGAVPNMRLQVGVFLPRPEVSIEPSRLEAYTWFKIFDVQYDAYSVSNKKEKKEEDKNSVICTSWADCSGARIVLHEKEIHM